ncbi:MAG: leucyl aminopeptidase [Acidobacteriota bacterium]|jgi:leucyl aminopeptidase|nr:leucyl aminopeptidase [Acidobacteriota bacterium]
MAEVLSVDVVSRGNRDADLLILGAFEGEAPDLEGLDEEVRRTVERLAERSGWKAKEEQSTQTALVDGPAVLLTGLGKSGELSAAKLANWIGRTADYARGNGYQRIQYVLPSHRETAGAAAAERVVRCLALSGYRFERRSEEKNGSRLEGILVAPPAGKEDAYRNAVSFSRPIAEAAAFSRTLANTPPNEATTLWMAERAREMAEERGITVTILDEGEMASRGMNGILAVGSGSAYPPRLVRLDWGTEGPVIALVGKGVTFDTGGISIKPAQSMEDMKYDKCGACTVLGIVRAVADLGLKVRIRAYCPFTENMPSGSAYRPGDIIRFYNGKMVEITNTDAEGRLILADAMAWAAEEKPDALVEFSTLTGAIVVALGHQAGGLFTPDDGLASELLDASADTGERLWRMPLYPEYLEDMKGVHADLKNSAGRAGSSSTAAAFLSQFVGEMTSWAHLDIAGVAYLAADVSGKRAGATGFGIASTVSWLRRRAG